MNWIKCIERLPSSDTAILFIAENRIYVGSMSYAESWSASDPTNITKHYSFKADIFLKEEECCEGNNEPLEVEFIERALSWDLSSVSYWMPLPHCPEKNTHSAGSSLKYNQECRCICHDGCRWCDKLHEANEK